MNTFTPETLLKWQILMSEAKSGSGHYVDYLDVVNKVFVGPDLDAIKFLVNESSNEWLSIPKYDENLKYQEKVDQFQEMTSANIGILKEYCLEVNF